MNSAGKLSHRVSFYKRGSSTGPDYGNVDGAWLSQPECTVAAQVQAKFGGEAVTQARLQSQQPVTIVVRQSSKTRLIKEDWKAVDTREGTEYAIRSIVDPDDGGAWLELLCQAGVAA